MIKYVLDDYYKLGDFTMFSANNLLDLERCKKKISLRKLTNGICSHQLLMKSINKDTNMDFLSFEILLERVGRSPEYLEFILSKNEYDDILRREEIESCIYAQNHSRAKELLILYIPDISSALPVQKMYYYRILAWISFEKSSFKDAKEYILKSIYSTLPGITTCNYTDYLFSSFEYENILFLSKTLFMLGDKTTAIFLAIEIFNYASKTISDKWLLASILPKCAYLLSTYDSTIRTADYMEQAIDLLRDEGIIYLMLPLLTSLIKIYTNNGLMEKAALWSPFKDAVEDIFNTYVPSFPQDSLFFRWKRASYNLDCEIFHAERMRIGISQEELSEGIFSDPGSVSRLETQRHAPNNHNYKKLMTQFNINKPRKTGFVLGESFDQLEQMLAIRTAANKADYDYLLSLNPDNYEDFERLFIDACLCIAQKNRKILPAEELIKRIKNHIEQVYPLSTPIYARKPFSEESYIITSFLAYLSLINDSSITEIYGKLMAAFDKSAVKTEYSYSNYTMFIANCLSSVGKNLSLEYVDSLADKAFKCALFSGNGNIISGLLHGQTRSFRNRKPFNIKICKQSYLFAELYKENTANHFKDYYLQCLQILQK